uniref:uncharacterized protein LOC100176982 isoform X2 n=1 Tax=Ciona intestinalis TaxID=7719 RepID=UPI000EF4D095|nr:uncharacterized protein LOC100176982 isoform X2 [Ciona intestinalis]|eukprot:XP_026694877.1 uncharacterized protein LOC100176982 isoform X2 [Ciona intestinalis]
MGRAWLFVALNESHLEGFLNSFQHNPSIVDEYYLSHAILSTPQLLLLQSLMCGLEHVNFSIEPDVHYLDIPVFPVVITHPAITPPTQSDCTVRSKGKPELSHQNSNLGSAVVINPDALVNAASKGTELAAKALRGVFGNNQLRTREVVLGDEMPEVAYYELPKALQDVACFDSIAEQQGTELTCMGITVKENTICKSCSFDLNRCQCGSSSKKMNQRTHIDSDILIDDGPIRVTRQLSTRKKHSFKHTTTIGIQCDDILNDTDSGLPSDIPSSVDSSIDLLTAWLSASHHQENTKLFGVHEISTQCNDLGDESPEKSHFSHDPLQTDVCLIDFVTEDEASHSCGLFCFDLTTDDPEIHEENLDFTQKKIKELVDGVNPDLTFSETEKDSVSTEKTFKTKSPRKLLKMNILQHEHTIGAIEAEEKDNKKVEKEHNECSDRELNETCGLNKTAHTAVPIACTEIVNNESEIEQSIHTEKSSHSFESQQTNKLNIESTTNKNSECNVVPQTSCDDITCAGVNTYYLMCNAYAADSKLDPCQSISAENEISESLNQVKVGSSCILDSFNASDSKLELCSKDETNSDENAITSKPSHQVKVASSCASGSSELDYPDIYKVESIQKKKKNMDSCSTSLELSTSSEKSLSESNNLCEVTTNKHICEKESDKVHAKVPVFEKAVDLAYYDNCETENSSFEEENISQHLFEEDSFAEMEDSYVVDIDSNLHLQLMLDVVLSDDEKLIKLFRTRSHSNKNNENLFILFTNSLVYFLTQYETLYVRQNYLGYFNVDVLHSNQGLIFSEDVTSNTKCVRCNTSDSTLTRLLLFCFQENKPNINPANLKGLQQQLHLYSDWTKHTSCLESCVSSETGIPVSDCDILLYSLIEWKTESKVVKTEPSLTSDLSYKAGRSFFGGEKWVSAYFVLEDGLLYQYKTKNATKPDHCYIIEEEISSVERGVTSADFSVILRTGSRINLRASDDDNAKSWIEAIASFIQSYSSTAEYPVNCSLVIATKRLFICHEDHSTGFCRCLSHVQLSEVTHVEMNYETHFCCVYFKQCSPMQKPSSSKACNWQLQFPSAQHCEQFENTMKDCCYSISFNRLTTS